MYYYNYFKVLRLSNSESKATKAFVKGALIHGKVPTIRPSQSHAQNSPESSHEFCLYLSMFWQIMALRKIRFFVYSYCKFEFLK